MPGIVGCNTIVINEAPAAVPDQEKDAGSESSPGGYCSISVVREIVHRVVLPYMACSQRTASSTTEDPRRAQMLIRGRTPQFPCSPAKTFLPAYSLHLSYSLNLMCGYRPPAGGPAGCGQDVRGQGRQGAVQGDLQGIESVAACVVIHRSPSQTYSAHVQHLWMCLCCTDCRSASSR
jgi:hypothetical protein